jgi:hypothetical protein
MPSCGAAWAVAHVLRRVAYVLGSITFGVEPEGVGEAV